MIRNKVRPTQIFLGKIDNLSSRICGEKGCYKNIHTVIKNKIVHTKNTLGKINVKKTFC